MFVIVKAWGAGSQGKIMLGSRLEEGKSRGREQEIDFSSPKAIHELKSSLIPWVLPSPTSCPEDQLTGMRELQTGEGQGPPPKHKTNPEVITWFQAQGGKAFSPLLQPIP